MVDAVIASRKRRILAFLIDHIIFSFLAGILGLFVLGSNWDEATPASIITSMFIILPIIFIIYFCKDSVRGMSPGRYILGIAVRNRTDPNSVPSILRLALRNVILIIWPVEFLILVFSREKRRLGDLAANTIVLRTPSRKLGLSKRIGALAVVLMLLVLLFIGSIGLIIKNSAAYKVAIAHIENNPEVQAVTGPILGYGALPTGSIQVQNQNGYGQLNIKVKGKERTVNVIVILEKAPGTNWQIKQYEIKE